MNLFDTDFSNQTITCQNFAGADLKGLKFNAASVSDCDFSRADLTSAEFTDCTFTACNFSNTKMTGAKIRGAKFKECKFMGVDFSRLNSFLLSWTFEDCKAEFCDFKRLDLRSCVFVSSSLKDSDFSAAVMHKTVVSGCNLLGAVFVNTDLREADFTESVNCIIDPSKNKVYGAMFSLQEAASLLAPFGVKLQ